MERPRIQQCPVPCVGLRGERTASLRGNGMLWQDSGTATRLVFPVGGEQPHWNRALGSQAKNALKMNVGWSTVLCCYCLVAKSCPTLCDPVDCSPPGSSLCGISQVRILAWVAISFSRGSSWPRDQIQVCCIAGGFFTAEQLRVALVWRLGNKKG